MTKKWAGCEDGDDDDDDGALRSAKQKDERERGGRLKNEQMLEEN